MNGSLFIILQQIINQATTNSDIESVIAEYILRNLDSDNLTISQIANDCHISKASVTRFAQNIGYTGFGALKEDFDMIKYEREELKLDVKAKQKENDPSNETKALQAEFHEVVRDFETFSQAIDFEMIEKLCDLIHEADDIYIIATLIPENLSKILQTTLLHAGKFVYLYPSNNQQYEIADKMKPDDLALFVSLEGSHIMNRELTLSITNTGAKNVLLTQNPDMKLSAVFDYIIALGEHDIERSGKYKLLLFIEYFSHFYLKKYNK